MPLPAPPADTARVAITGEVTGVRYANIFWLECTTSGTPSAADVTAVGLDVLTNYADQFKGFMSDAVTIEQVKIVYFLTAPAVIEGSTGYTGDQPTGAALPDSAACVLVNWDISSYYRGGHPRTYLPCPDASIMSDTRRIDPTQLPNVTTAAGNFITAVNAGGEGAISTVTLGTLRRHSGGAPLTPPVFYPYTGGHGNGLLATQRRRLGRN
jgi:hypothetical protein